MVSGEGLSHDWGRVERGNASKAVDTLPSGYGCCPGLWGKLGKLAKWKAIFEYLQEKENWREPITLQELEEHVEGVAENQRASGWDEDKIVRLEDGEIKGGW